MDKVKAMNMSLDEYIETIGIDKQCNEPKEQESGNEKIPETGNLNGLHMSLDEYIKKAGVDKKYKAMKERNSMYKNFNNNNISRRNQSKKYRHYLVLKSIVRNGGNIQNGAFGRRVDQSFGRGNSSFSIEIISPKLYVRHHSGMFENNNQSRANVLKSFDKKGANIQNSAFGQRVQQSFGRGNSSFPSEIISPELSVRNQSDMLNKYNKTNNQTPAYVSNIQNGPFGRRVGQSFIRRNSPFPSELISPDLYARNKTDVLNNKENAAQTAPNANKFGTDFFDVSEDHEKPELSVRNQSDMFNKDNKNNKKSLANVLQSFVKKGGIIKNDAFGRRVGQSLIGRNSLNS